MKTQATTQQQGKSLTVHRLEIPSTIAAQLAAEAAANERTIPGQVRVCLRQWAESLPSAAEGLD